MDARAPLPLPLLGLLLLASGVANSLPPACNTLYKTSWVQYGGKRSLSCPTCRPDSRCYWGAFNNRCELQEDLHYDSSAYWATINSNADAKRFYCCSNQSTYLPQQCFAVYMCAHRISVASDPVVYVGYESTITVVLTGYPIPVHYSGFCTPESVTLSVPVRAVPPDEANVTFSYAITASSTSRATCSMYYQSSIDHCTDLLVSIGEQFTFTDRVLFCSFVDINPAIYQASDDDPSTSLSTIAVSHVHQTVESPSPHNTFTSDHTVMWSSSPHSQLSWETSLPLTSVLVNGHAVTTMAGLSSAVVLAAILLLALIMVCIKLEAYDICFPSKKNGNRSIVQNRRARLSEGSTPLSTPTDEAEVLLFGEADHKPLHIDFSSRCSIVHGAYPVPLHSLDGLDLHLNTVPPVLVMENGRTPIYDHNLTWP
ncbi:hypothetical protein EMCRGX_G023808 [Ephydatia muelleri]